MSGGLYCNVHKCNTTLNGRVWVTRCLHVFCPEHGASHFHNNKIQVYCPVCNEINVRENDVLLCNTHPNDMILAGLRPEKILRLVERSYKLWKCQIDAERNQDSSKIYLLSRQLEENANHYKRCFQEKEIEHTSQIAALQTNYNDIMVKLKQVTQDLEITKSSLRKYKVAYDSLVNTRAHSSRRSPIHPLLTTPPIGGIHLPDISSDDNGLFRTNHAHRSHFTDT